MFNIIKKEQLRVPAHIDYLGELRDFITQIGKKHVFSDKIINAFKLSIDEVATNIIKHSYQGKKGFITIRSVVKKKSLTMCIVDQGIYFDPRLVEPPDINHYIAIQKKGGLGIFIIRKLMDKIDYRKTREGNELRLTKNFEHPLKRSKFFLAASILAQVKNRYSNRTYPDHKKETNRIIAPDTVSESCNKFGESASKLDNLQLKSVDVRLFDKKKTVHDIQQNMIQNKIPELEGYDLAIFHDYTNGLGNDYFNISEIDDFKTGIAVAECRIGTPNSEVMTLINMALQSEDRAEKNTANLINSINTSVCNNVKEGLMVTMFYLVIDSKKHLISYAGSGQVSAILYRYKKKQSYYLNSKESLNANHFTQKESHRKSIVSESMQVVENDFLVIYTNGLTTISNSKNKLYGKQRLIRNIRMNGHLSLNHFIEKLKEDIDSFSSGCPRKNDITLVALKRKSIREQNELIRAKEAQKLILAGTSIREACAKVNLSIYSYYKKYKKLFDTKEDINYEKQ